jgi:hypothetical protein
VCRDHIPGVAPRAALVPGTGGDSGRPYPSRRFPERMGRADRLGGGPRPRCGSLGGRARRPRAATPRTSDGRGRGPGRGGPAADAGRAAVPPARVSRPFGARVGPGRRRGHRRGLGNRRRERASRGMGVRPPPSLTLSMGFGLNRAGAPPDRRWLGKEWGWTSERGSIGPR